MSRSGLETEDLVAFANSKNGGAILIGVDEHSGPGEAEWRYYRLPSWR